MYETKAVAGSGVQKGGECRLVTANNGRIQVGTDNQQNRQQEWNVTIWETAAEDHVAQTNVVSANGAICVGNRRTPLQQA